MADRLRLSHKQPANQLDTLRTGLEAPGSGGYSTINVAGCRWSQYQPRDMAYSGASGSSHNQIINHGTFINSLHSVMATFLEIKCKIPMIDFLH